MSPDDTSPRERLLDAAERLFSAKGYAVTTLRDISCELGLSHASLYYHFPGGKVELFAAVTERNILHHGAGLLRSIEAAGSDLRGKLRGAAAWLLSQSPMDLIRMAESDMPALPEAVAKKLMDMVYVQMILRLRQVFQSGLDSGELGPTTDPGLMAGAFLGLIESLHSIPEFALRRSRTDMAHELVEVLLKGLDYSKGGLK